MLWHIEKSDTFWIHSASSVGEIKPDQIIVHIKASHYKKIALVLERSYRFDFLYIWILEFVIINS